MDFEPSVAAPLSRCLEDLAAGDLAARDRIIELCAGQFRSLASRMLTRFPAVRRWDDTDDVFQNAAMRLHRALGAITVASPREVLALAATQIHRELIDLARRHAGPGSYAANHLTNTFKNPDGTGANRHIDAAVAPADRLDRWAMFHEAIAALSPEQREVFQLVWYLGADQKTIARLLDCSERTVKSRWREAREAVRRALDGESPE